MSHNIGQDDLTLSGYEDVKTATYPADNEKGPSKTTAAESIDDVEASTGLDEESEVEQKRLVDTEKKEVTAVEAFQWSVDGDQSPCACLELASMEPD